MALCYSHEGSNDWCYPLRALRKELKRCVSERVSYVMRGVKERSIHTIFPVVGH